jgi:hypothetical protein
MAGTMQGIGMPPPPPARETAARGKQTLILTNKKQGFSKILSISQFLVNYIAFGP